jgi:hypothetical protein
MFIEKFYDEFSSSSNDGIVRVKFNDIIVIIIIIYYYYCCVGRYFFKVKVKFYQEERGRRILKEIIDS